MTEWEPTREIRKMNQFNIGRLAETLAIDILKEKEANDTCLIFHVHRKKRRGYMFFHSQKKVCCLRYQDIDFRRLSKSPSPCTLHPARVKS